MPSLKERINELKQKAHNKKDDLKKKVKNSKTYKLARLVSKPLAKKTEKINNQELKNIGLAFRQLEKAGLNLSLNAKILKDICKKLDPMIITVNNTSTDLKNGKTIDYKSQKLYEDATDTCNKLMEKYNTAFEKFEESMNTILEYNNTKDTSKMVATKDYTETWINKFNENLNTLSQINISLGRQIELD